MSKPVSHHSIIPPSTGASMVRLALYIKAELTNVVDLQPASDDFEYSFKVQCTKCRAVHPNWVTLNHKVSATPPHALPLGLFLTGGSYPQDKYEVSGGKNSTAHFVWRCHECKCESSAKFETSPVTPYSDENVQFAPLLIIECRGLEFTDFDPSGIWKCSGTSGTSFTVDLEDRTFRSEGVWSDYDEKAAVPVGISEFASEWRALKGKTGKK
ncbi:DUF866-domain-containing protein [Fistulina hepatica ATCC 64428]|uniref:DUF866-domain-containing protein n=1 Tax=Fistulina hepatica ATCC 64428 TaxID=1128425 RepID=A0A0D7AHC6_9AGAR|nr:DUF866-domain-containing protein [Fistulina hepatica ATCC 64428]